MPNHRIKLSRRKGFRKPPDAVVVSRPSKWGNMYSVKPINTPEGVCFQVLNPNGVKVGLFSTKKQANQRAVELFRATIKSLPSAKREDYLSPLQGKSLACWCGLCPKHHDGKPFDEQCPDCDPCHGDVLGELANKGA